MNKRARRDKTQVDCIDLCGSPQKSIPIRVRKPRKLKRTHFKQGNLFDPGNYVTGANQA